jgi:hypothetical protein
VAHQIKSKGGHAHLQEGRAELMQTETMGHGTRAGHDVGHNFRAVHRPHAQSPRKTQLLRGAL